MYLFLLRNKRRTSKEPVEPVSRDPRSAEANFARDTKAHTVRVSSARHITYLFVGGRLSVSHRLDPRRHPPLRLAYTMRTRLAHLHDLLLGSLDGCRQSRDRLFQRECLKNQFG